MIDIQKQQGITLMEIMVVIVIIAVLASLAYPSFKNVLSAMESRRIQSILQSMLYEARAHSHITKQNVLLCLADEAMRCHRTGMASVILFVDNNDNNIFDEMDVLLKQEYLALKYGALQMNMSLRRPYMKYFGTTATPKGHFGHFSYCGSQHSHRIVVSALGNVRVQQGC